MHKLQPRDSSAVTRTTVHGLRLFLMLGMAITLAACGDKSAGEVKGIKQQVQRAYGNKDFSNALGLSQKGLTLARKTMGDTAADTLYFVQAVSEVQLGNV